MWSRSREVGVGVQKEFLITGVGVEKIYADSNTDSILVNFIKIRDCFILFLFQWNEFHFILIFHYFFFFLSEFIYLK